MNIRQSINKKGFTLIELLVVMVIIAILAALAIVAYGQATRGARNAQRIGELNSIQGAFEQYYSANGTYSATCSSMAGQLQGGMPTDPTTGSTYSNTCTTSTYCVCAGLEGTGEISGGNINGGGTTGGVCTGTWQNDGNATHYCVQNKQ